MKRRFLWLALAVFAVAGCDMFGSGQAAAPDPVESAVPDAAASSAGDTANAPTANAPTGGARQVVEETDAFLFEYAYPQEAGDEPGLAAWLDRRLDRERGDLEKLANEGRERARDNGFPFNKYSSNTVWAVVADLPDWLSLSSAFDTYEGGAHPNYGSDAVIWDRANARAVAPSAFFISAQALDKALNERLCEALNSAREGRRGTPVDAASGNAFDDCVPVADTTMLLGSANGRVFDRIGIQIAPGVAGAYAEGAFEFTFPVDAAIMAAVKPRLQAAFAKAG